MTKEDEVDQQETRFEALLAVNLVSQVLEEAYVIANAAKESGEPWLYISMLKNLKNGDSYDDVEDDDTSFATSKGDSDVNENKMESVANVIATSTPQKIPGDKSYTKESNFIGQGDEEMDLEQGHLMKSTSVFINNLFDMSEVEHVIFCDDNPISKNNIESNELLTQAMTKIMESYINIALGIALDENLVNCDVPEIPSRSTEYSDYSFLADEIPPDIGKDVGFFVQDDVSCTNEHFGDIEGIAVIDAVEVSPLIEEENHAGAIKADEVALYENTYLTLNRDYEQYSDDGDPILQDPKELALQEIELMTTNTSENNLSHAIEQQEKLEEPTTVPEVSGIASVPHKGSLVRRCRDQGARLWVRLRGWWRRKTPGKHRRSRVSTLVHGMCPLSPDARRRAASLLDQRLLRSPSPSRPTIWKFNTVNEALVNSSRWKEYTFDASTDD